MASSQIPAKPARKDAFGPSHAGNTRVARISSPDHRDPRGSTHNSRPGERRAARSGSTILASGIGFLAAATLAGAVAWSSGCHREQPPGPSTEKSGRATSLPSPSAPTSVASAKPSAAPSAAPSAVADVRDAGAPDASSVDPTLAEKPYTGPLLGAMALQTPIYPTMEFSKKRLGYVRHGGKVPVDPTPIKAANCQQGWFKLVDGGYVCGKYASIDLANPSVRLGITPPNLEDVLPYKYAYNTKHGTPLYHSVPSREEMLKYEPYLEASKKARKKAKKGDDEGSDSSSAKPGDAKAGSASSASGASSARPVASAGDDPSVSSGKPADPPAPEPLAIFEPDGGVEAPQPPPKLWWEDNEPGKTPSVTLADLEKDRDDTVAKRMVKGFFIAVDKTFGWNGRLWYKTTSGLVAPSDRMYIAKPPTSQGIVIPDGVKQVGFITATKASKWTFDEEHQKMNASGTVARFAAFGLTGATKSYLTVIYRQTTEGWWMKAIDGTYTEPGPPPEGLAPGEKWIDVNLTRKTLVAFEGDKPVYAALVSPGKKSKNKAKDHSTVKGTFRIREKHIAVTMDGDGTVAGDLPYSIEDVPYVSYFEGSYALHGAFWHNSFGREMSHGCVNLSPLDAKYVFFWSEPRLPRGWHAVWATPEHKGTTVVTHE